MAKWTYTLELARFGVFEVDLRAGELRKSGVKVKLQEQPFQILAMLLQRPGAVVTREELRQKLWPEGTFVDFEHGLNAAVNRLREALDDSPDNPRFVETLPRRGYRFIAPVEVAGMPHSRLRATLVRPRVVWWIGLVLPSLALAVLALLIGVNVRGLRDRLLGRVAPGEITAIAVLPLENLSGNPEDDPFVDGMTEELITALSKIGALKVISRTSVMRYKGTDKLLPDIARELGVDAVIEGSVLRAGEQVRITAQLVNGATDETLWAESYERDLRDVLALQSEVARAISREIRVAVTREEEARLASNPPVNPGAYEAYLKGRYFLNWTPQGAEKALEFFHEAIKIDPHYAPGYAGIADAYNQLEAFGILAPTEAFPKAKAAAIKAAELDDTLAEAHFSLAQLRHRYDWDWSGAEREYKHTLELNPSHADAYAEYAFYLSSMGQHEEGIAESERAVRLDPRSVALRWKLTLRFYYARRYDEAIEECQKLLEMQAGYAPAHGIRGAAYLQKGMYEEGIRELQEAETPPDTSSLILWTLAYAYAVGGKREEALKILDERREEWSKKSPYRIALIYAGLGQKNQAFKWLEKSFQMRETAMVLLKVLPEWDPLRSDPRFQSLLRRMNFPE